MLKQDMHVWLKKPENQPPSGGCVLKPVSFGMEKEDLGQPPSGGCVLKLRLSPFCIRRAIPAAFRRLCVETMPFTSSSTIFVPAAFRRLCVETILMAIFLIRFVPAAFRRLCVETTRYSTISTVTATSRLQAAVC